MMTKIPVFLFLALPMMFATGARADGAVPRPRPEIAFEREIEVSDRARLSWSDIATVKHGTDELAAELAGVTYEGGGAAEIRRKLRERRSATDVYETSGAKITIPQDVTVRRVKGYSSAEFRRKILAAVQAGAPDHRFELRAARDGNVRLASDWTIGDFDPRPRANVLVPVSSQGVQAWIPVQFKVTRDALVLKRSVPFGWKLTADDVEARDADVGTVRETPAAMADLGDAVAARALTVGRVLTLADLKREEMVKRGQPLKLTVGTDDFEITVSAVAEEAGRMGDLIKVKNAETGKQMSAVVDGRGRARVQ